MLPLDEWQPDHKAEMEAMLEKAARPQEFVATLRGVLAIPSGGCAGARAQRGPAIAHAPRWDAAEAAGAVSAQRGCPRLEMRGQRAISPSGPDLNARRI